MTYLMVVGLVFNGLPTAAWAAIYTWNGSTGTWSTADNWTPSGPPGAGDTALFGSTGATSILLGGSQSIGNITFQSGASGFTFDTSGTSNMLLLGDAGTIWSQSGASGAQTIWDAIVLGPTSGTFTSDSSSGLFFGGTVTGSASSGTTLLNLNGASGGLGAISGVVADGTNGGNLALNKTGLGTWTLSGDDTYSGGTTISGGTLSVDNPLALGTGSVVIDSGATLGTTASFSFGQPLVLGTSNVYGMGGGTVDVAFGTVVDLSGPVSGNGGLTKTDGGTLVLDGANSYAGLTAIKGGNLVLSGSLAATSSTAPTLAIDENYNYTGLFNSGSLVLANGYTPVTVNNNILINGGAANLNVATIFSNGNNTLSGNLTFNSAGADPFITSTVGMLTIEGNFSGPSSTMYPRGNGNQTYAGSLDNFAGTIFSEISGGTLILSGNNSTYAGIIIPTYAPVQVSSGTNLGTQGVQFDTGTLMVRADPAQAASFSNTIINFTGQGSGGGNLFLDRAVGGSGLNQTIAFGDLTFGSKTATVFGLDGYGATFVGAAADGYSSLIVASDTVNTLTTSATLTNDSSGLISLLGSVSVGGSVANRSLTLNATGDMLLTGNLVQYTSTGTALPASLIKSGYGTLTIEGTASTITAGASITNGTLAINQTGAVNGQAGNTGGGLSLGSSATSAALSYLGAAGTGAGETSPLAVILAGTTGSGMLLGNQQQASGNTAPTALDFSSSIAATGAGSKSLILGGFNNTGSAAAVNGATGIIQNNSIVNEITGVIEDNSTTNVTSLVKNGSGTWLYAPAASSYATTAPAGVTGSGSEYQNELAVSSTAGLVIGESVSGTNVPAGAVITSISGNDIYLNTPLTSTVSSNTALTFGTVGLAGAAGENFTGSVTVAGGMLQVQPTAASGPGSAPLNAAAGGSTNSLIFTTDATTLNGYAGGIFQLLGTPSGITGPLTTNVGATLTLAAGAATIETVAVSGGGTPTLEFMNTSATPITRTAGAVVDFIPGSGSIQFNAQPTTTDGILGGYAYFTNATTGAVDFATVAGSSPYVAAAYSNYTPLAASGTSGSVVYSSTSSLSTTGAESVYALKLAGPQMLSLGGTLTVGSGGVLFDDSTGPATISGSGSLGGAVEMIVTVAGSAPANALTVATPIGSGSGSLTKAGSGTLVVTSANTFTGNVTVDEGTLQLSGLTASLGSPAAATTFTLRQNTTLDVNGAGGGAVAIGSLAGAGTITNSGGGAGTAVTLDIGTSSSTANGVFSGILEDGAGVLSVTVDHSSTYSEVFTGLNTYSGGTTIAGGVLQVSNLPAAGSDSSPSSIGELPAGVTPANSAPYLVFGSGTGTTGDLLYEGASSLVQLGTASPSVTIDRLFTLAGNATIDSSGTFGNAVAGSPGANSAALVFSNTAAVAFSGSGARTLTLQGSSISDNEMGLQLIDNPNGGALSVTKAAAGTWLLSNNNTYSGATTITGGALRAQDATTTSLAATTTASTAGGSNTLTVGSTAGLAIGEAIFGAGIAAGTTVAGFAGNTVTMSASASATVASGESIGFGSIGSGGLSPNSNLLLNGGVLETSGSFTRSLGTGPGQVQFGSSGGGFAGSSATLEVAIGGTANPTALTWGSGNFLPSGAALYLGSSSALSEVQIVNPLNLGTATTGQTINVQGTLELAGGSLADYTSFGTIESVISGGPATNGTNIGLIKAGAGELVLVGANSYTGNTQMNGGTLVVYSLGMSSTEAAALGTSAPATSSLGAADVATLGTLTLASGTFEYVGAGETSDRPVSLTGGTIVLAANGSGPLTLTNLTDNYTAGTQTLDLQGYNTDWNTISANLADNSASAHQALSIGGATSSAATWVLTGNNTFTGGITLTSGELGLGSPTAGGSGTLTINGQSSLFATVPNLTLASTTKLLFDASTNYYIIGSNSLTATNAADVLNATIINQLPSSAAFTLANAFTSSNTANATITVTGQGNTVFGTSAYAGVIANNGSDTVAISYIGSGSLTLGGTSANTYTGATTLNAAGILILAKSGALGTGSLVWEAGSLEATAPVTLSNATSFSNSGSVSGSPSSVIGSNSITFAGGETFTASHTLSNNLAAGSTLTFATGTMALGSASTLTLAGTGSTVISGPITGTAGAALVMNGSGSLTLSATNTFSGSTAANAGTLALNFDTNNTTKLSSSAALILGGGTLELQRVTSSGSFTQTVGSITLSSGSDSHITISNGGLSGTTNLASTGTITANAGGVFDFTQPSSGAGSLSVASASAIYGWATIDTAAGNYFAANSAGTIVAATTTSADLVTSWTSTENVSDSSGYNGTLAANTTINSLRFNENTGPSTVTVGSGIGLTVTGGGILETPSVGLAVDTITGGTLTAGSGVGELIVNQENTTTPLTIASAIVNGSIANMPLVKASAGTLILTGANTYTGATYVNEGTLELAGSGTLGTFSNVVIGNTPTALLELGGTSQTIGTLASAASGVTGEGTVDIGSGALAVNETASTTFSGELAGSGELSLAGSGTLSLNTTSSSFSGTVSVSGGMLDLGGNGVANLPNVSAFNLANGGALSLDNTGSSTLVNRTSSSVAITLTNTPPTGAAVATGLSTTTDQALTENVTVGAVTLGGGTNTLRAVTNTANGNPQLTMASLTRTNYSTLTLLANDLGSSTATTTSTTVADSPLLPERGDIIVTNPANLLTSLVGGGSNTADTPTISILPWAVGQDATSASTSVYGSSFVTYNTTIGNGFLALNPLTDYEQLVPTGGVTLLDNARYATSSGASFAFTGTGHQVNSLLIDGTGSTSAFSFSGSGAGDSLSINSGAMLFVGPAAITVNGFDGGIGLGSGVSEYVITVNNTTTTIASDLTASGAVITKSGSGTLILNDALPSGPIYVNEGTLGLAATSAVSGTVTVQPGASLSLLSAGDGTGSNQTITTMANEGFDFLSGAPAFTVGPIGSTAANKTIEANYGNTLSVAAGATMTVTYSSGFGLQLGGTVSLPATGPATLAVGTTTTQTTNTIQALTIAGTLSGGQTGAGNIVFNKTGAADLVLSGTNSFGGGGSIINVQQGLLGAASDAALGDPNNVIELNPSTSTVATFAAFGTFATSRTIELGTASYTRQIDVTSGNTLTLDSAFDVSLAPTASLTKVDAGTLVFGPGVNNNGWTGALAISQGAVELTGDNNLNSLATITATSTGAALQLDNVAIANPLTLGGGGVNGGGALEAVGSGTTSTASGLLTSNGSTVFIGADPGATLNLSGGFSGTGTAVFLGGGSINISGPALPASTFAAIDIYNPQDSTPTNVVLGVDASSFTANIVTINSSLQIGDGTTGTGQIGGPPGYLEIINSTLSIDDAGGAPVANRLGGAGLYLYGSTLNYIVNGTSASSEAIGNSSIGLILGFGLDVISVSNANDQNFALSFYNLSDGGANAGGIVDFQGAFGTANQLISFNTAPTLTGGLIPYAIVGTPDGAGGGIGYATYSGGTGITAFTGYTQSSDINPPTLPNSATVQPTGNLTLNVAARTLNALDFNSGGSVAVDSSGTTLALSAASIMVTNDTAATIGSGMTLNGGSAAYVLLVNGGSSMTLNGTIANSAYFDKELGGNVSINTPQYVATNSGFVVGGGTVTLAGGNNTIYEGVGGGAATSQGLYVLPGATLDLNGTAQMVNLLETDNSEQGNGGTITSSQPGATFVLDNRSTEADAGQFTGGLFLAVSAGLSSSYEDLSNNNTYNGGTLINGGYVQLFDGGQLSATSSVAINYAELELNDNNNFPLSNRVDTAATVTLAGGMLGYSGRAGTISSETLGPVVAAQGVSTIWVAAGGAGVNSADLQIASFSQTAGAVVNFIGSNLGLIGSGARLGVTGPTTPVLTNNIVGGWAIVNGTDFASYIPYSFSSTTGVGVGGFGALGTTGYAAYDATSIPAASQPTENIKLSGGNVALPSGGLNLNTLNWATTSSSQAFTFANDTDVLNLTAGGLLKSGAYNNTIGSTVGNGSITAGGTAASGTQQLYITNSTTTTTPSTLTINSAIIDTSTALGSGSANVQLVLTNISYSSGIVGGTVTSGSIALAAANTYSGGAIINGGTVNLDGAASTVVLPAGGVTLNGASLVMNSNPGQIDPSNTITLNGLSSLTLTGSNTLASLVFDDNGGSAAAAANPTVSSPAGTVLTLSGSAPITAGSSTPATVPTIASGGSLDFSAAQNVTLQVNPVVVNDQDVAPLTPSLNIASVIQNDTANTGVTGGVTGLTVAGGGLLELSGANTFSGGVALTGGSGLDIVSSSTGSPTVTSGPLGTGTLAIGDGSYFANSTTTASYNIGNAYTVSGSFSLEGITGFTLSGPGTFTSSDSSIDIPAPQATLTLSGELEGDAGMTLTKTGYGTLSLTSNNSFSSDTSVELDGGTLIAAGAAGATPSPLGSATVTINGGQLELFNNGTASNTLISYANTMIVPGSNQYGLNLSIGDLTANTGSTVRIAEFEMAGGQTLSVAANNAYNLRILDLENSSSSTPVYINPASASTAITIYSYTGATPVLSPDAPAGSTLTIVSNPAAAYWAGGQDANWNTVNGTTTVATNWVSSATGGTDIQALPGGDTDVYFTANTVTGGHDSTTLGQDFTINSLTFTGAGADASNPMSIGGTHTLSIEAAAGAYAAGTGIVVQSGAAASTITANIALGASQSWTNNSSNPLSISGGTISGSGYSLTISGTGNTAIADPIQTSSGGLVMNGSGTLTLSGDNSYSGGTNVTGGTLSASADNNLGSGSGAVTLSGGGTLEVTSGFTTGRDFTFGAGGGDLTISSGQTLVASGGTWSASSGGGVTLEGAGTLQLNSGSYGSAEYPLAVTAAGGTLSGTATVLGNITINSGATVAPGTAGPTPTPGTLSFNGTGTLAAGGNFGLTITNATGTAGTDWNLLAVGSLAASGLSSAPGSQFNVTLASLPASFNQNTSYQWDFITAANASSAVTASEFSLNTSLVEPGNFSFQVGSSFVALDYSPSAVPEPGSMVLAALAALGTAGMGWRQRRRRQAESRQQLEAPAGA